MTDEQKEALAEGRRRFIAERRQRSCERVWVYQAWMRAGSVMKDIPEIPSDGDFRISREEANGDGNEDLRW